MIRRKTASSAWCILIHASPDNKSVPRLAKALPRFTPARRPVASAAPAQNMEPGKLMIGAQGAA